MEIFKKHIPFHLYLDDQTYFTTARTLNGVKYFNDEDRLLLFKNRLDKAIEKFNLKMIGWVIIPNHYHLMFRLSQGNNLPKIFNFINGGSSFDLNKFDNQPGRQIWWNYWDRCIRSEPDFYTHFNYIHNNPIKHGLVNNFEALSEYKYSSYIKYLNKYGLEWLMDCFNNFPIVDYSTDK